MAIIGEVMLVVGKGKGTSYLLPFRRPRASRPLKKWLGSSAHKLPNIHYLYLVPCGAYRCTQTPRPKLEVPIEPGETTRRHVCVVTKKAYLQKSFDDN